MRIMVTGSSSHLAQALLPMLCATPAISQVTGIDIKPAAFTDPKFHALQADLTQTELAPLLRQQDALIHLAFVVLRGKTPLSVMRSINIDTSMRLFDAATESGLARVIHLSSASVYGNGSHLDEHAEFQPVPGFIYAEHKAELETWLANHHPQVICLRPHIILGKHAQPLLLNILRLPFYVQLPDPQPQLQCIHENDVARAILLALTQPASGAYNLASNASFSFRAAILQRHRLAIPLPARLARLSLTLLCKSTGIGGEAGWIDGVYEDLTLDCSKAQRELGWQAEVGTDAMFSSNQQ